MLEPGALLLALTLAWAAEVTVCRAARAQQGAPATPPLPPPLHPAPPDTGRGWPASDTARVTYQTSEVIFVSAGSAADLAVGDTIQIEAAHGAPVARAVVLSVARQSASAAPIPGGPAIAVGQLVRFVPHRVPQQAVAPAVPAESLAAAPRAPPPVPAPQPAPLAQAAAAVPPAPAPPVTIFRPAPRWRASFQLNQSASSAGGPPSLTTYATSGSAGLSAPLASWLTLDARSTTWWRNGSGGLASIGLTGSQTWVYRLALTVAPPGRAWSLALGRFLPEDALGLGYVDGAKLEVRPWSGQRVGLVAGYAPDLYTMAPSTRMAEAGAWWGVSTGAFSGSVSAATQWQWSQIRRTWVSGQAFWTPAPGLTFSLMTDVDHGAGWEPFRGFQLTDLSAGMRSELPFGFHAGLVVESHAALPLFTLFAAGDTLPLPGRLNGATFSLGHRLLGASVDVSAGYLKRATDPAATWQGTLTVFSPRFMLVAMGQHGTLFNFGSLVLRVPVPGLIGPFNAAMGFGVNLTALPGGAPPLWRYDLRPELGWRLGRGFYFTMTGDVGRYAGQATTYLQAGVGYQLW